MSSLSLFCPSCGQHEAAVTSWQDSMSRPWPIIVDDRMLGDAAGFLIKCELAWRNTDADVIGYLHSDMFMLEKNWDVRILMAFDDPRVAVVGVVGATGLGHEDLYKIPYSYTQLARCDVWSNLTDWEVHGGRETDSRQVAVIDSCAVFTRRSFLARHKGWPIARYPNSSHCSDLWLCCVAHRAGMEVHMVGIRATHASGGRGAKGEEWLSERGGDREAFHQPAHTLIYEDFRDVLPVRIK